jgi:hypothetical protein
VWQDKKDEFFSWQIGRLVVASALTAAKARVHCEQAGFLQPLE